LPSGLNRLDVNPDGLAMTKDEGQPVTAVGEVKLKAGILY